MVIRKFSLIDLVLVISLGVCMVFVGVYEVWGDGWANLITGTLILIIAAIVSIIRFGRHDPPGMDTN